MKFLPALLAMSVFATGAAADTIEVDAPWVRATAPGQQVAAGFMHLTADADMKVVGGESVLAESVELHIMRMENGVMEMRQLPEIALPKGETVKLSPGGLHVMFIGLKQRIRVGTRVPLTLKVQGADGKESELHLQLPVSR